MKSLKRLYFVIAQYHQAIKLVLVLMIASFASLFFSLTHESWLVLTAILVTNTTIGTPLRQSMQTLLVIVLTMLFAFFLKDILRSQLIEYFAISLLFIVSNYFFLLIPRFQRKAHWNIYFLFVLLIVFLIPVSFTSNVKNRLLDIIMGGVIGISITSVFKKTLQHDFQKGISPALKCLRTYSQTLSGYFLSNTHDENSLDKARFDMALSLLGARSKYPEWVYDFGFNPALRAGFRFFLVHLEAVTDSYFALNYLFACSIKKQILNEMMSVIEISMQKNEALITALLNFFIKNEFQQTQTNFTDDIEQLETTLKQLVPPSLELLDMSEDYILLTSFVRDIKDIRGTLLELILALPQAS